MLSPYRALDLADEKGLYCGKVLADLGCEVIKVEKPGGDAARHTGPFYHDDPDPRKSLSWFAFNTNKKSITLDIESGDGRDILKRLIKNADFLIESFSPGYLDSLGLGYPEVKDLNPRIIMTSISPFGQTGPYKDFQAPDIVCMAMSGYMYLCGDADRPPVRISAPQAYLHASADAAVGSLIAHYHRQQTAQGQHVDVSAQESLTFLLMGAHFVWMEDGRIWSHRSGTYHYNPSLNTKRSQTWSCKNGAVGMQLWGGAIGSAMNKAMVGWMDEEGMATEFLKTFDWDKFDVRTATQDILDQIQGPFGNFFLSHTKEELYQEAIERRILLAPVSGAAELSQNPQLQARDFWTKVDHPELADSITYPGSFFRSSAQPKQLLHRAPLAGEHNDDFYVKELGLPAGQLSKLKQDGII